MLTLLYELAPAAGFGVVLVWVSVVSVGESG